MTNAMNSLSLRRKLWLPVLLAWLCLLGLCGFDAYQLRGTRLQERQLGLQHVSEVALSLVQNYAKQAENGSMTVEQAKTGALAQIKALHWGKDGYFTVVTSQPVVVMHPIKPELVGKDMSDFKDATGFALFVETARIGKTAGEGTIRYVWARPGETEPVPKLAYVLAYKPWDWNFMAGVYLDDLDEAFKTSLMRSAVFLTLVGVILTWLAAVLNGSINRSLGGEPAQAANVAARIADGDLATEVVTRSGDRSSMLFAMSLMQKNLTNTIAGIKSTAEQVASASKQIAAGNIDLSQRTEEQAASLEQTAASMEELTSTVRQNAENAAQSAALADHASKLTEQGSAAVNDVVTMMARINESSSKIAEILGVIDGIAFQTNILALNAAVEAARAGEQGRGFAVVASEVRTLAQRSADAAREIKALISNSVAQVQSGSALVEKAGESMRDIMSETRKVAQLIGEISSASREQSSGIEQVRQAVGQMDSVTQQNAALVEQAAASAQALESQAARMASLVASFRVAS